ncbi:hypothetical protein GCM10009787_77500 [Streptomyces bangladeshensis]|uniref:Uncharacterized protein n=1 Tax=Streptomyces bangladeshensis TaxID=295352 RepID=A0ABN1ZJS5_9ACTN
MGYGAREVRTLDAARHEPPAGLPAPRPCPHRGPARCAGRAVKPGRAASRASPRNRAGAGSGPGAGGLSRLPYAGSAEEQQARRERTGRNAQGRTARQGHAASRRPVPHRRRRPDGPRPRPAARGTDGASRPGPRAGPVREPARAGAGGIPLADLPPPRRAARSRWCR